MIWFIRCIGLAAVCLTLGWPDIANSHDFTNHDLRIVTADDSDSTKHITAGLLRKFPTAVVISDPNKRLPKKRSAIYITVGPAAFRSLLGQDTDGVITSVFTSRQAYKSIIMESAQKVRSSAITAIYAEPSPTDQMRLISMLYKKHVSVAMLLSEKTEYLLPALQHSAAQTNLELDVNYVYADDNLNRALNRIARAQVLLAIPDSTIFNAENIRNILMTTYRQNKSVVGFSSALVKAGVLASTYSDIEDVIAQTDEILTDYAITGRLQDPQYPKYFSTVINDDVARSLNLVIDDGARKFSRKPMASK